jgi:hypothetical protein
LTRLLRQGWDTTNPRRTALMKGKGLSPYPSLAKPKGLVGQGFSPDGTPEGIPTQPVYSNK